MWWKIGSSPTTSDLSIKSKCLNTKSLKVAKERREFFRKGGQTSNKQNFQYMQLLTQEVLIPPQGYLLPIYALETERDDRSFFIGMELARQGGNK